MTPIEAIGATIPGLLIIAVVLGWLYVQFVAGPAARRKRQQAYTAALGRLAADPQNAALRTAALAAGRAHHGGLRPGGAPTVYDEQAIMNDLVAHSGGR